MKILLESKIMYSVGINPFRQTGKSPKWFVCFTKPDHSHETLYLHKDGSTHTYCGERGFFQTKADASIALAVLTKKQEPPFLPKELFEI